MVKCSECGFLAVRDEYNDETCEATDLTRGRWMHKSSKGNSVIADVFCFKNAPTFTRFEKVTRGDGFVPLESRLEQIATHRECDSFCRWNPGKTPKEHEAMQFQDVAFQLQKQYVELHEKLLVWRQEQSNEQRQWDARIQALEESRHQESLAVGRSQTTGMTWQTIISVAALIVSIGGLLVSLLISKP